MAKHNEPKAKCTTKNVIKLSATLASKVKAKKTQWLWTQTIALNQISMIVGQPGLGKSQLAACIAAIITTGKKWPATERAAKIGSVIMISPEDEASATIRPRLDAAGADPEKVHIFNFVKEGMKERSFDIGKDIPALGRYIRALNKKNKIRVRAVFFDPMGAVRFPVHREKAQAIIEDLRKLAKKRRVAIILLGHLNRQEGGNAYGRIAGSSAAGEGARAIYLLVRKPDSELRYFATLKNNLANDNVVRKLKVTNTKTPSGLRTSRIRFVGVPIKMSIDEVLDRIKPKTERTKKKERADTFLSKFLAKGPKPSKDVYDAALSAGISKQQIRKAAERIGAEPVKDGFGKGGIWRLQLPKKSAA